MGLSVKKYKKRLEERFLAYDHYDFRNDPTLYYKEAVLIEALANAGKKRVIEEEELEAVGYNCKLWWNECVAHIFQLPLDKRRDIPWEYCFDEKGFYPNNLYYDEKGNVVSWKEVSPFKEYLEYERKYRTWIKDENTPSEKD